MGLADRWSLWEWAPGLPGNRFLQAGLLGLQEVGFALLCSPRLSQEEEQSPPWLECWWSGTLSGLLAGVRE